MSELLEVDKLSKFNDLLQYRNQINTNPEYIRYCFQPDESDP